MSLLFTLPCCRRSSFIILPCPGRFSEPQRILYEIVLRVLELCTEQVNEKSSLNRLYHFMLAELGRQAKEAGVIKTSSRLVNEAEVRMTGAIFFLCA